MKSKRKMVAEIKFSSNIKGELSFSKWTIIISAITIVALAAALVFIIRFSTKSDGNMERQSSINYTTREETTAPKKEKFDWKLALVNGKNPMNETVEVIAVKIGNNQYVDKRIHVELQKMLDDAKLAGKSPLICSSYRTQEKQKTLYENKVSKNKKSGMNQDDAVKDASGWVAYPGTSEHQLGLAVDIVDKNHQVLDESQENTATTKWLMENCQNYGFILRYPTNKSEITGVNYEPWHYRYVGEEVAKKIMNQKICLEEYLSQSEITN